MAKPAVAPGEYFVKGNEALAEGAIAAGCRFYGGYPITPSSEIAECMSRRMPQVGGQYIQMEDEIASITAIIGASCGGAKAMTATSGPGFSLMQEGLGLAYMTEVPCVVADVQRGGPSTGLPTLTSQGDMMQARYGSHGDYEAIAYSPATVQEMFDLTVKAFDTAERLRTPVLVMADQVVGQMTGRLRVPPPEQIRCGTRARAGADGGSNGSSLVPPMALAGDGKRLHMTGLTHGPTGFPATNAAAHEVLVGRLLRKVRENAKSIQAWDARLLEDARIALIVYGSMLGPGWEAVQMARKEGLRVGMLRLVTPWPFPHELIKDLSNEVDAILVAEANMGQIVHSVREHADCPVHHLGTTGGRILRPDEILRSLRTVAR